MEFFESAEGHGYTNAQIWDLRSEYGNKARNSSRKIMDLMNIEAPELAQQVPLGNRFMYKLGRMHPVTATFTPFYLHDGESVALRQRTFDVDRRNVVGKPRLDGYDIVKLADGDTIKTYASYGSVKNDKITFSDKDPREDSYDESADQGVLEALNAVYEGLTLAIAELRGPAMVPVRHEQRS